MIRLALIFLALLTMACSSPRDDSFNLQGFSDDQKLAAKLAADTWCNVSDGELCAAIDDFDSSGSVMRIVESFNDPKLKNSFSTWQAINGTNGEIEILDHNDSFWGPNLDGFAQLVAHELGHHFGCETHLESGHGYLMQTTVQVTWAITQQDLDCARRKISGQSPIINH
jgi:hypothetical protein